MRWSFKKELGRKAIHLSSLLLLWIHHQIMNEFGERIALFFLLIILIIILAYEYIRLDLKLTLPLQQFIRYKERSRLSGATYVIVSMIICLSVFERQIGSAAMTMFIISDAIASLVGVNLKGTKIPKMKRRTVEATFACFAANLISGIYVLHLTPFLKNELIVALLMSITSTLVGLLTYKLEDNLGIPIATGFVGQLSAWLLK